MSPKRSWIRRLRRTKKKAKASSPPSPSLPPRVRKARAYARKLVASADKITYSQTRSRPMTYPGPEKIPRFLDCSSAVTTVYEAAGLRDPNGRGYDGQGYTGTLVTHGRSVKLGDIQPCDLVFYGHASARPGFPPGAPTHVAMVMDRKGSIFTFGSDPGPSFRRIDYRSDFHSVRRYIKDLPIPPDDV